MNAASSVVRRWISRILPPKPKPSGYVHIYAPPAVAKSLTRDRCIDCKQQTIFVGFHYEWHGWTETCIRCGRRFADGEWLELEFSRTARTDSIKSALELWGRYPDAERIHRVKVKPSRDRDCSAEGDETPQAAQPEARARAEGIAQVIRMPNSYSGEGMRREKGGSGNG